MIEQETIKALRAPFPPEAIQIYKKLRDPDTGEEKNLVGYKPQYIIERLNDSFGHENWDFNILQLHMDQDCAWCWGKLTIYISRPNEDGINGPLTRSILTVKEHVGSCENKKSISYGDAMKGAATNCMEKCASMVDIGQDAYKGLVSYPGDLKKTSSATPPTATPVDQRAELLTELKISCKDVKIGKEAFKVMVKNVLKSEKGNEELTIEDIQKLIDHVKKSGSPF